MVRDCRIELREVPLAPICIAYGRYLAETGCSSLDSACTGMFGLAYLIERKAWGMMPQETPEPEDPVELDPILPFGPLYGSAVDHLLEAREYRERLFFRQHAALDGQYELPLDLSGIEMKDLVSALRKVLDRAAPEPVEEFHFKPRASMSDLIKEIRGVVARDGGALFDALLPDGFTRRDVVWTFLAILEMIRLGFIRVTLKEESIWIANLR